MAASPMFGQVCAGAAADATDLLTLSFCLERKISSECSFALVTAAHHAELDSGACDNVGAATSQECSELLNRFSNTSRVSYCSSADPTPVAMSSRGCMSPSWSPASSCISPCGSSIICSASGLTIDLPKSTTGTQERPVDGPDHLECKMEPKSGQPERLCCRLVGATMMGSSIDASSAATLKDSETCVLLPAQCSHNIASEVSSASEVCKTATVAVLEDRHGCQDDFETRASPRSSVCENFIRTSSIDHRLHEGDRVPSTLYKVSRNLDNKLPNDAHHSEATSSSDHESGLNDPTTSDAFQWLHHIATVPLLKSFEDLGGAYKALYEANALHLRMHDTPSNLAIYNMVRCLSLGVAALCELDSHERAESDVSQGLPPEAHGVPFEVLANMRLDLAIATLDAALDAGYAAGQEDLALDPDLQVLRDKRPLQLDTAIQRAHGRAIAGNRVPQLAPPTAIASAVATYKQQRPNVESPGRGEAGAMASTTLPKPGPPPTAPPGQFRAPEPVIATIEALCSEAEIPKPSHTDAAISKSSFMLSSLTGLQEEFHAPTVVPSEVGKMFPSVDTPNIDGMFASAAAVENLRFPSLDGLAEQLKAPEPITASFMTRSSKRTGARRSGSCPPQSSSPMASHPIRGSSQSPSARIQTSEEVPLRWLRKWCAQQTGMHHCFSIQGKSKHFD